MNHNEGSPSTTCNSQGAMCKRLSVSNIPPAGPKVNKYLVLSEKLKLAGMMAEKQDDWFDDRHGLIAANLQAFLEIYPASQHGAEQFVFYLRETGAVERCGGADYVLSIFAGIEGNDE